MASDPVMLPAELRTLLEHIDSFEKLEVMSHVLRNGEPVAISALAEPLHMTPDMAETAIDEMVVSGLLRKHVTGTVSYIASPPEQDAAVRALMRLYDEDKLLVVRAITQVAMDRLRSQTARVFADAFVVRRPPKKEPDHG